MPKGRKSISALISSGEGTIASSIRPVFQVTMSSPRLAVPPLKAMLVAVTPPGARIAAPVTTTDGTVRVLASPRTILKPLMVITSPLAVASS
jgi:hypothetical protein